MAELFNELDIVPGVTAIIGSGGKTTLMYALAQELSQRGSVIVTTTTHIWKPEHLPVAERVQMAKGIVCVGTPCKNGKLTVPQQSIQELAQLAEYVLVEADGSAGKPLKAHAEHEPVIPENVTQVICVLGASGLNLPAQESVHRPEIFCRLTGSSAATVKAVAALLKTENLFDRLVINQCDMQETAARELAEEMNCPVLLTSLKKGEILCAY